MQVLDLFASTQGTSTIKTDIKQAWGRELYAVLDQKMKARQDPLECLK